LNAFLKRKVVPETITAQSLMPILFMGSILSPILTHISWNPSDAIPAIRTAFQDLPTRFSTIVTELKPLPRSTELGIFMSTCALQLLSHLKTDDVSPKSPPAEIQALFSNYQETAARFKQDNPATQVMRLFLLFSALGHDPPSKARFPIFLLADIWSSYGENPKPAVAFVKKYAQFLKHVDFMEHSWQRRWDEDLARLIADHPSILTQSQLDTGSADFSAYPALRALPPRLTWSRLRLIAMLHAHDATIRRLIPDNRNPVFSLVTQLYSACRAVMSTAEKIKQAEEIVIRRGSRIDNRLEMRFNRYASREFRRDPNSRLGQSLMRQMVDQFEANPQSLRLFNKTGTPWHVFLEHEGATDAGGPGRDVFTDICLEIMHPSLALFVQSPNMTANHGTIRDVLIPNPEPFATGTLRERMFYYAGVIFSVCYISRMQASFRFARFVWAALTGVSPAIEDIFEIDEEFQIVMTAIQGNVTAQEWDASYRYTFEIKDSLGHLVELFPGGSQVPVTFERRLEFVERAKKCRLKEFTAPLDALRRGFQVFFAPEVAALFSPWEMELLCCGDNDCPVHELKKLCSYQEGPDADKLWKVLGQLTPAERKMFIKFGTGRGSLPPPGVQWQSKLQIVFLSDNRPDRQKRIPMAETCFSKISIPRYDSCEVYAFKLRQALALGVGIEDHEPNWREMRDFFA
jgi:hypothetical protein